MLVDAQIVLSWLLNGPDNVKQIFTRNRLQDIKQMCDELFNTHKLKPNFFYVPTEFNVGDFFTRSLSTAQFKKRLNEWQCGPQFLEAPMDTWNKYDL